MNVQTLLDTAVAAGFILVVRYGDEIDYRGQNVEAAMDAIEACDEMEVHFHDEGSRTASGWALIFNDLEDDEKIADCSGIVNKWLDEETH